jgi:hypothetical protein
MVPCREEGASAARLKKQGMGDGFPAPYFPVATVRKLRLRAEMYRNVCAELSAVQSSDLEVVEPNGAARRIIVTEPGLSLDTNEKGGRRCGKINRQ